MKTIALELHRVEVRVRYMNEEETTPFAKGHTTHFPKYTLDYVDWLEEQIEIK